MKVLRGAENLSNASLEDVRKKWKFTPGGLAFVKTLSRLNILKIGKICKMDLLP